MNITVRISPTLTQEQQQDPRFKVELQAATNFFNSDFFVKKYRSLLCIHEAGHIVYARLAGATDIGFHGPMMRWCDGCSDCKGDAPSISKSSVSWTLPLNCDVIAALKADIGGIVFREILTETPNDAAAVWSDMKGARKDYECFAGGGEEAFLSCVEKAREEIIKDLRSPEFRKLAWDTAREFEQAIFPAPKLTSAVLRAKRLAWMQ